MLPHIGIIRLVLMPLAHLLGQHVVSRDMGVCPPERQVACFPSAPALASVDMHTDVLSKRPTGNWLCRASVGRLFWAESYEPWPRLSLVL